MKYLLHSMCVPGTVLDIGKTKINCHFWPSRTDAMAPHSSTLAWKIPWMEEPGRLQPMGSRRVGHEWATSLSLFTCMHWRRKRQPAPVFLPGESQGQRSLVGCHLWGYTELDTTEALAAASLCKLWISPFMDIFQFEDIGDWFYFCGTWVIETQA